MVESAFPYIAFDPACTAGLDGVFHSYPLCQSLQQEEVYKAFIFV